MGDLLGGIALMLGGIAAVIKATADLITAVRTRKPKRTKRRKRK